MGLTSPPLPVKLFFITVYFWLCPVTFSLLALGFLWLQQVGATLKLWCTGFSSQWLLWQSTPWFTKLEPHCCFSSLYLVDGHSLLHSVSRLGKTELKEVKSRGSESYLQTPSCFLVRFYFPFYEPTRKLIRT